MRTQKGWFLSFREIAHAFYRPDQEMCSYGAWHWLLSEAAFKDHPVNYKGRIILIKRGQVPISLEKLAGTFKWSINRLRRWLKNGVLAGHIEVSTDMGFTIITICKYGANPDDENETDMQTDSLVNTDGNTKQNKGANKKAANNRKNESNEYNEKSGGSAPRADTHAEPPLGGKPQWHIILQRQLGDGIYKSWIRPLSYHAGHILCSTTFVMNYCNEHYRDDIEKALNECGLKFQGFLLAGPERG